MKVVVGIKVPGRTQFESHQCLVELSEEDLKNPNIAKDARKLVAQAERRIIEWQVVNGHITGERAKELIALMKQLEG